MRYTLIATALIGAVVAMPAAPASYGEAPAAYNAPSYDSEDVYGTQVSNVQTTTAALPSSTCTDEAENVVPYTTPVAQSQVVESSVASSAASYGVPSKSEDESSVPAKQTNVASSTEVSPGKPEETPAGYASKPAESAASSSETSAAETPAGYATKPANVASSTEVSPQAPEETKPVESAPAGYAASSAVPKSPESTSPATEGETESSPESPAQYGSTIVPGSAPTAAPYPVGGDEASPVSPAQGTATGTIGAAKPTGTGSVSGHQEFEGAASSITAAGLFVSFGAVVALFM